MEVNILARFVDEDKAVELLIKHDLKDGNVIKITQEELSNLFNLPKDEKLQPLYDFIKEVRKINERYENDR